MSIWGKLAGAAAELVRGSPPDSQVAFTVGVITLGAKIAKADGVVTDDEVNRHREASRYQRGLCRATCGQVQG